MIAAGFCFKMSRIPDNVNLSDRYAVLLDESSKENQLTDRDQRNATKFEDLSNKVGTLCQLLKDKLTCRVSLWEQEEEQQFKGPCACKVSGEHHFYYLA